MTQIGTKVTSYTSGSPWREIPSSGSANQQGILYWRQNDPGFATQIGFWGRKAGSNTSRPQAAIWERNGGTDALPTPGRRLGYTNPYAVSNSAGGAGIDFILDIAASSRDASVGVIGAPIPLQPGTDYTSGLHVESGPGIDIAAPITIANRQIHVRGAPAGLPTDPFQHSGFLGPLNPGALYVIYEPATAPTVAMTGPGASISTASPTFAATTTDPDRALYQDRLAGYTIELRLQSDPTLIWNPSFSVAPGSTEFTTGNISRAYDGPALSANTYMVRIAARDLAGAVGAFSDWRVFTIANLPYLETDVVHAPLGKQESGVVSTWSAKWKSPAAKNATHLKVQVLSGGSPIKESAWVALAAPVAPDGTISRADSVVGLTQGTNALGAGFYTWRMKGRDVDGAETEWSDPVEFQVNFPPLQPSGLRPISGTRVVEPPRVDWFVDDLDDDDSLGSGLTSEWRVTNLRTAGQLTGRTSDFEALTGRAYMQFTTAQFPQPDDFMVEVRGVDLSAEAEGGPALATAYSAWSSPITLTLYVAPTVTINIPTQGMSFATASPQISFSVGGDGMTHFRVEVYSTSNDVTPIYSSGTIEAQDLHNGLFTIPPGFLSNGQIYRVRVFTTLDNIESNSPFVTFSVQYDVADMVNGFSLAPFLLDGDYEAATVQASWEMSGALGADFAGYLITRRLSSQERSEAVTIAHIREVGTRTFYDYHAPPNDEITYGIMQLRRVGADILLSDVSEETITIDISVPVIASLWRGRGQDLRSPVIMLSTDYAEGFQRDETTIPTWGNQGKPTLVRSPEGYGQRVYSIGFRIRADARGTLKDHLTRWRNIVRSGHPYSLRTETEVAYVRIVPAVGWLSRSSRVGVYEVALTAEEIAWSERVAITT
jgi:hypothetical protein